MRRMVQLVIAMLAVVVSLVWGLAILTADVHVDVSGNYDNTACGSAWEVATKGHAMGGGEMTRPDEQCAAQARKDVRWALAPALTGLLALGYLGFRWTAVVREVKERNRSRDTLTR